MEDYRAATRAFAKSWGGQMIEGLDGVGVNVANVAMLSADGLHYGDAWCDLINRKVANEAN